ncbi:hypothetical protein BSKO_02159 [Bryopsis sp. KO-2023]|nr:hypothetical protein BSKO_02159 [Bryopsis sp. KO-2023]
MSRMSTFLLLGLLAATVSTIHARSRVYEQEWDTGVPGVTGHSVLIVQDNLGDPTMVEAEPQTRESMASVNAGNFFAWANRQFEMLSRMQNEGMSNHHAVVLVNGVPMHVVVHSGNSQMENYQDVAMPYTGQKVELSDDQGLNYDDYEDLDEQSDSVFGACIWRVVIVSLMVACACAFLACIKHACDMRKAAIKHANKKATFTSEKVPLLTVLAPEGMAKEPAIIQVTSADVEYTLIENQK